MPSLNSLPRDVEDVVLTLCEDLATPVSLSVAIQVRYKCWDDIASRHVDPKLYLDAESYWRDAAAASFLRKTKELPTTIDRKAVAVENFWKSERLCYRSNERLSPYLFDSSDCVPGVMRIIRLAQKKMKRWLGRCPDLLDGRFGPGSTFGDRGKLSTIPDKMSSRPTLTASSLPFLFPWSGTAWAKACAADARYPLFVRGNRFTTVPKDCTKDRGICIEPSINLFYQLAYGQEMKVRLKQAGLNLRDGQDIHRQVACESSLSGEYATIDLSNASDTVCSNLVKLLLPRDWFDTLMGLRSSHTLLEGKWVRLEKFSSMGNGFTFELETIIFAAISAAICEARGDGDTLGVDIYVFGDDIIVRRESAEDVIAALRFFGFEPNGKKTFLTGSFRESCGGDFFDGVWVRPYFLEELPCEPQQYIAMANGLRRMADPISYTWPDARPLRRSWFRILDALPSNIRRLRGPKDLGDLTITDDESNWTYRWKNSIRYIRAYCPARFKRVGWEHFKPDVVLASALYGAGDGKLGVSPRDNVEGYKESWVSFS